MWPLVPCGSCTASLGPEQMVRLIVPNLGVWDTTAVPRLRVRLVLAVAVALGRTACAHTNQPVSQHHSPPRTLAGREHATPPQRTAPPSPHHPSTSRPIPSPHDPSPPHRVPPQSHPRAGGAAASTHGPSCLSPARRWRRWRCSEGSSQSTPPPQRTDGARTHQRGWSHPPRGYY